MLLGPQTPAVLDDYSEPFPDVMLLHPKADFYSSGLPRVEDIVVMHVTDLAHGIADDFVNRNHILELLTFLEVGDGDLTTDDDKVALGVSLAGDAAGLILGETGVEDCVGNGVANLIRMTFTDGFGSKNETTKHEKVWS